MADLFHRPPARERNQRLARRRERDVQDAPEPGGAHRGQYGARAVERRVEVLAHDGLPLLRRERAQRPGNGSPRRVHEHDRGAERSRHVHPQSLDRGRVRDVGAERLRLAALLRALDGRVVGVRGGRAVGVARVARCHETTRARERHRAGAAHTAGGPGDERDAPGERRVGDDLVQAHARLSGAGMTCQKACGFLA